MPLNIHIKEVLMTCSYVYLIRIISDGFRFLGHFEYCGIGLIS